MRTRRNCFGRFSTLLASCLAYWAAWLASLLAITSFPARVAAETITLPDPLYTNQFTTVEAWVQLETTSGIVLWEDEWDAYYDLLTGEIDDSLTVLELLVWEYENDYNTIVGIFDDYEQNALSGGNRNWRAFRSSVFSQFDSLSGSVTSLVSSASFSIDRIGDVISEIDSLHRTNIVSSVSFGQEYGRTLPGGGCSCPDYTVYLSGLQSELSAIHTDLNNLVFSVARAAILRFGSATGLGEAIGDKYLFLVDLLNGILGNLSLVDEDAEDFGQRLSELGYTLSLVQRGDEQNLRYYNVASNLYAHLIDGWCFPTNIEDRPLWVTFDQDVLRGLLVDVLDDASIKVSVTNALKVSVTNELQIAVTNDIHVVTDVSQEITQIENNMSEIEDMAGNLHVDEVAEITDTIQDRTHLFDGWDARIRQFPERFESLWNTQYTLPESIIIYDGYSATVRSGGLDGWHGSSGSGSRRSRSSGDEEILTVPTLELYIGPEADTASGRWIYRIATACHNVTNVIWSLLFLAILVKLFKIDIFLLRSSCFIFLAWLSALGVGGMRRLSIMEAMAESFDRIAKLFTSMFGDGGEDAA